MKYPVVQPTLRNMQFSFDETIPRYWHGGDPAVTALFNALSLTFPEGERFFIRSVQHFAPTIDDPELKAAVKTFSGQEGVHSREHERMNEYLAEHWGPQLAVWGKRSADSLRWVEKRVSPHFRLAMTCALEHMTAIMGEALLSNDEVLKDAHPEMARLWRWHAGEEIEHKAVAFDVYEHAGGTWFHRSQVMVRETMIFLLVITILINVLLRADKQPLFRSWMRILGFVIFGPLRGFTLFRRYLEYFSPSFHPWRRDNRHLLAFAER